MRISDWNFIDEIYVLQMHINTLNLMIFFYKKKNPRRIKCVKK